MEISILLVNQILAQFIMILTGFALIKTKLLKQEHITTLSTIGLYIIFPCVIINSFQIAYSSEILNGLILSFSVVICINILFVALAAMFKKIFKLNIIEQVSLIYPNVGNLVIPLVAAVLGPEWQVYCCAFVIIQTIFIFTHGIQLLSKAEKINMITIIKNPNILATFAGGFLFFANIQLPSVIANVVFSFSSMVAPACMLVIGMAIGNADLRKVFMNPKNYLVCGLRLLAMPLIVVLLIKLSGVYNMLPNAKNVLLVVVLGAASSIAATVTQLAEHHHQDYVQASLLNVMSVTLLVVTMPFIVFIYMLLI